jgi:Uma2 family endonuclease
MSAEPVESTHPLFAHEGPWTEADFLALPEIQGYKVELEDGEIHMSPMGSLRHQRIVGGLYVALYPLASRGFWVLPGADVRLQIDRIFVPDVVVLHKTPDPQVVDAPYVQLALEVVSTWGKARDRMIKPMMYGEAKIPWYLRVEQDPRVELFLYRCEGTRYTEHSRAGAGQTLELPGLDLAIEVDTLLDDE